GLTFADVLSAHPEILHPLSGTGRPAHSPALIPVPKRLSASLQMPEKHHSLLLFIFSFPSGLPVFSSDCAR
ncbi:hypothetical protein ACQV2E_24370, partial [Pantoea allii]|uniref:hypothetical protein n=1 Tax=Pantoea allii TaxID=574096 RepID=UPI003D32325D